GVQLRTPTQPARCATARCPPTASRPWPAAGWGGTRLAGRHVRARELAGVCPERRLRNGPYRADGGGPVRDGPGRHRAEPSWHSSPDGKTWTFRLRKARFSNGEPVTAEDVKFTLDRFMDPKLNVNIPSLAFGMKRVEIVDARTVRIRLAFPVGAFLINVSVFPASIISKKQFLKLGKKYF